MQRLAGNPEDIEAKNHLGILLCKGGELTKAKDWFMTILEKDKANGNARNNLGNTYVLMKKPSEAIDQYRLVPGNDQDPEALFNMGVAYFMMDKNKNAEESLRKAYSSLPETFPDEKKLAWMLGVSDLKYEKMSLSDPWMEKFTELIYKATVHEHRKKVSSLWHGKQSESSQEGPMNRSEVLWWKF